jgi:hypothetical protein
MSIIDLSGVQSPRPRQLFLTELGSQIQSFQQHGHALIVMMDANETLLPSQGDLRSWISQHDLHDIHKLHPAPSTYIGSTHRRIDFMFGCHQILPFIHRSGTLSYIDGPQSDHRSLYIDVALSNYLNYDANNNTTSKARILKYCIKDEKFCFSFRNNILWETQL